MKKHNTLILLIIIFFLTFGFACEKGKTDQPVKIGVAVPLSGRLKKDGTEVKNVVELAVNQINTQGGLMGRKVVIQTEDDACDPEKAKNAADKLVNSGVIAVIGHVCSGATQSGMSVYGNHGITVISPASTNPDLTLKEDNPTFFRTIPHNAAQSILLTNFIKSHLKIMTNVAIIHNNTAYGIAFAGLMQNGLDKAGIEVSLYDGIAADGTDYSSILEKIKKLNPKLVVLSIVHPEAIRFVTQARKIGIETQFVCGHGCKNIAFTQVGGKNVEGTFVAAPVDISLTPLSTRITQDLKALGKEPGLFGLQAHAAVTALFKAIDSSQSTQGDQIRKTLRSQTITTTMGDITFDKKGDIVGSGFAIYKVENGAFQPFDW